MDCEKCGRQHLTRHGGPACTGHRTGYWDEGLDQRVYYPLGEEPPCTNSPMHGQSVCHAHGGRAAQAKAAGQQRYTEQKAATMAHKWGLPIDTTPTEAILKQVTVWAGIELYYRERVEELTDEQRIWGKTKTTSQGVAVAGIGIETADGTTEEAKPHVLVGLHAEASHNLVKFASEAIKAGIEERRVRLAEQQGAMVADVIKRILEELHLTPEQAASVGDIVPRHLRLLTG